MVEAQKDLELVIKGKKVVVAKDDHYFTEEGTPVVKHAPLKRIAKEFGVKVDRVVVDFPPVLGVDGLYIAHRAFGTDENGNEVSAVGEANPLNLEGLAAQYPVIMSNKRAEDRLLIVLLGLEGEIYSESEIAPTTSQVLDTFPFGKYAGKSFEEVKALDKQYLEWFANKWQPRSARDQKLQEKAKEILAA